MKIHFFFIELTASLLLFSSCGSELNKDDSKPSTTQTIYGKQYRDTVFLDYTFFEKTVRAQQEGKIERLLESPTFNQKNLLVQYDDYEEFVVLSGGKEALKEKILVAVQNFPEPMKPIKKKWSDFAQSITPGKILPSFPSFQYKEEAGTIWELKIIDEYNELLKQEHAIQDYFQMSTEAGILTERYAKSGDYVKKNSKLLSYIPRKTTINAHASFEITSEDRKQIETNLAIHLPLEDIRLKQLTKNNVSFNASLTQKITIKNLPAYFIITRNVFEFEIPAELVNADETITIVTEKGLVKKKIHKQKNTFVHFDQKNQVVISL